MQHFIMSLFRAVESKKAIVRAANTGISGIIDPIGRIKSTTPLFLEKAETDFVPMMYKKTFYTKYGDIFALLSVIFALLFLVFSLFKKLRIKK